MDKERLAEMLLSFFTLQERTLSEADKEEDEM